MPPFIAVNPSLYDRQSLPLSDVKPLPSVAFSDLKRVKRGKVKKKRASAFF
jgi:hypothetical protein